MRATLAILAILLFTAQLPGATAEQESLETDYLAGTPVVGIWCAPQPHPILPTYEPDASNPVGWLLSGEPECAAGDLSNDVHGRDGDARHGWGIGTAMHIYDTDDTGSLAIAQANDAVFGPDAGWLTVWAWSSDVDPYVRSEGCGLQSIELPAPSGPWQAWVDWAPWWASVEAWGVDDDTTVCFASTGTLHATWGHA